MHFSEKGENNSEVELSTDNSVIIVSDELKGFCGWAAVKEGRTGERTIQMNFGVLVWGFLFGGF